MKFIRELIFFTSLLLFVSPIVGTAASLGQLPSLETSNHWEVVIDQPKNNDIEPDEQNVYSMDIKYIGNEEIKMERVEVYRNC